MFVVYVCSNVCVFLMVLTLARALSLSLIFVKPMETNLSISGITSFTVMTLLPGSRNSDFRR